MANPSLGRTTTNKAPPTHVAHVQIPPSQDPLSTDRSWASMKACEFDEEGGGG